MGIRTIIFRGKRTINGEWIEGYLVKLGRESFSDPERYGICNKAIPLCGSGVCYNLKIDEVIPETVGQYTGLTDKNGKKIFEGDILSYIEEIETRSRGKETLKGIYEVKFEYCGFSPLDCLACNHLEIIGNIHDNPELLKGGEG